jgi:excisionase family DNA binding protein
LKEFLNIKELSDYLNMRKSTLYSMVENKEIPFFRFGRLIRFKKQEIDDWVEEHREESIDPAKKGREIFRRVKNTRMDIDRVVKKTIEEVKNRRYNVPHGKPDRIKGLREEVEDGTV